MSYAELKFFHVFRVSKRIPDVIKPRFSLKLNFLIFIAIAVDNVEAAGASYLQRAGII